MAFEWKNEKNTPKEYLAIRAQLVLVKKGILGFEDETLGCRVVIPSTKKEALDLAAKAFSVLDEYKGFTFDLEKKWRSRK